MPLYPKFQEYLTELDNYLYQIPISDRAEIITETKQQLLDAQEKNPTQPMSSILNSMGDPETRAKSYLQQYGLKIHPPKKTSSMMWLPKTIKWLVIGILGFMSITVIVALLIWNFMPVISIDNANHHVSIGKGSIKVQVDSHL